METLQFKTNIKCGGCIAGVSPKLNADDRIQKWEVDLQSPDRILTVETDKPADEVAQLVREAGFTAEAV
jgi:copper chaperone